jgi:hypothetical protein
MVATYARPGTVRHPPRVNARHPPVREDPPVKWTDATRPVTGAVSLALRAERGTRRALGRRAEDAALAALDAALASRVGGEAVDRVLASDLAARAVGRALEGPLVEAVARDVVRYAVLERLSDGVLDDPALERLLASALESPAAERLLATALDSPAAERMLVRVLDSKLLDEAVRRALEGEELWLVVNEIAQSPAVTAAITRQSIGFADQVAGGVRGGSRNADAWLERAARRALRRPPASP